MFVAAGSGEGQGGNHVGHTQHHSYRTRCPDSGMDQRSRHRTRSRKTASECGAAALRVPLDRGDDGCSLGDRRDGRSVIPTKGAIIPAAVGVDIGCGMMAVQTTLNARNLPDNLKKLRERIELAVPHGRTNHGGKGDRGAWHDIPNPNASVWEELKPGYDRILAKHPSLDRGNDVNHLGTLGTGNHFIEVCLDESENVWLMLHSGSRGVGNRIGTYFIELAKRDMKKFYVN